MSISIRCGDFSERAALMYKIDMGARWATLEPSLVYAEAYDNLATSITLNLHATRISNVLEYRPVGAESWLSAAVSHSQMPYGAAIIHRVSLTGLTPATAYEFRLVDTATRKFKTTALSPTTARIVAVSDLHDTASLNNPASQFNLSNDLIADAEPDLVLLVGDYLDDEGNTNYQGAGLTLSARWSLMLADAATRFIRSDGTLIPLVAITGNHDGRTDLLGYTGVVFEWPNNARVNAPSGRGYGCVSIGNSVLLVGLLLGPDIGLNPYFDEQKAWLTALLVEQAANYDHVVISAHVGPYPTGLLFSNDYDSAQRKRTRREIVPIIQEYPNVRYFVSGHDHSVSLIGPITQLSGEEDFTLAAVGTTSDLGYALPGGANPNGATGNARRWETDEDAGVCYIGVGGWGATILPAEGDELISTVDESALVNKLVTTTSLSGGSVRVVGGITPSSASTAIAGKHFWQLDFTSADARARCQNSLGGTYIDITR